MPACFNLVTPRYLAIHELPTTTNARLYCVPEAPAAVTVFAPIPFNKVAFEIIWVRIKSLI